MTEKIFIEQDLHDLIIKYFEKILHQLSKTSIEQKYILVSDVIRMAQNAPSLINNLEKRTKN